MTVTTHQKSIETVGYDICSPISGSMLPMIRPHKDSVLFVPKVSRLSAGDVALYKSGSFNVMHRVNKVLSDGYYMRGDNCSTGEIIREEQVYGVMRGFYRNEKYISKDNIAYRIYRKIWVGLNPLLAPAKKIRNRVLSFFRRGKKK